MRIFRIKQGLLISILLTGICLFTASAFATGGDMGVGTEPLTDGSETYPYLIEDLDDFDEFAGDPNYWASGVHTQLMTDIDLSGRTYATAVIAPDTSPDFGFQGTFYSGVFDGNNHTVHDLTINIAGVGNYHALFGKIGGSTERIDNLNITNMFIINGTVSDYIGGLVGLIDSDGIGNYSITNCTWNGVIHGGHTIGGLVGQNYGSIENCHTVDVNIQSYALAGGLVGANYGVIRNCSAVGEIIAEKDVGGLVGSSSTEYTIYAIIVNCSSNCSVQYNGVQDFYTAGGLVGKNTAIVQGCHTAGNVTGKNNVGGLIGNNGGSYGNVKNCYSTGSVNGEIYVGGLVGVDSGTVMNCFSIGKVSGISYIGGLAGGVYDSVINCLWDVETSGIGNPGDDNFGATGKSTAQMQTQTTFTNWDFATPIWLMLREGEDYPRLAWQEIYTGDIAGLYGVDLIDFAYLSQYWGLDDCNGVDDCGRADIDGSGDVGISDLLYVVEDWLE